MQKSNKIVIEIISLEIFSNSEVAIDNSVKQIYVEYTFLGYFGHLFETPQSVRKTSNSLMNYNFRKDFELEKSTHEKQLKLLREMLEDNTKTPLRLLVVSEPTTSDLEDDTEELMECEEIG